jgi:adenosylcobinamide-GDP ribazoletransferase
MIRGWEDFRIAGGFLTIFPVAGELSTEPSRLARSMGLFPAVGLVIGLLLVVINWALAPLLPRQVLDSLLVLILIVITGGLHLDGMADVIDGMAGGRDREGTLRIMKDSRVGAMGAAALVMILLLKYVCLHNLPQAVKPATLIFMPAAGRWVQVVLACCAPYVRPEGGTGAAFVEHVGGREFLLAGVTLAAAALVLFSWKGGALLLLLGLAAHLLLRYFKRRLGGVTGDVLGASTELIEVFTLLAVLALYRT